MGYICWKNTQKFVDCNHVMRKNILSEINGFAKIMNQYLKSVD